MIRTGVFYGTSSGNTLLVAQMVANEFSPHATLHNVEFAQSKDLEPYDLLVFGIPTWGFGNMQYDWEKFLDKIKQTDLSRKKIALFGLGDQVHYPETFLDGLGLLYSALKDKSIIVGFWPPEHYSFKNSRALVGGMLAGLAIDQDNEESLTKSRINSWCNQVKIEIQVNI
jgi:flavodoxin I